MLKKIICITFLMINICVKADAVDISAKSAVLYQPDRGEVVFGKNETLALPMASTTKIITAITAIENGNLCDVITTSKSASLVEGSSIWLEEGEKQTLENLLYGLMLSSGNDAAIAIAEHFGSYDNFVKLMNDTAKKAGAVSTVLKNPNGLDEEGHYTTALDMAKITAYAMKNETFRKIVSTKEKVIPWDGHEWGRTLKNHNKLLKMYNGADGVKTGYTKKDGRCLVSSAERDGVKLICVTLNAPDDWNDHIKLLDTGFSQYIIKKICPEEKRIAVVGGENTSVRLKCNEYLSYPVKNADSVEIKYNIPESVEAPVYKGQTMGFADIYINEKAIKKLKYISSDGVEKEKNVLTTFLKMLLLMLN